MYTRISKVTSHLMPVINAVYIRKTLDFYTNLTLKQGCKMHVVIQ